MTFSGHIAMSGIILALVPDPALAISACFLGHLVVDAIPHTEWQPFRTAKPVVRSFMAVDLLLTYLLFAVIYLKISQPIGVITGGILAGLLLDLTHPWVKRYLPSLNRLHDFMHTWPQPPTEPVNWNKTVTGRTPTFIKILLQISLIAAAFVLLYLM